MARSRNLPSADRRRASLRPSAKAHSEKPTTLAVKSLRPRTKPKEPTPEKNGKKRKRESDTPTPKSTARKRNARLNAAPRTAAKISSLARSSSEKKKRTSAEAAAAEPPPSGVSVNVGSQREDAVVREVRIGQIWAYAGDGDGGFPRTYARVDRIIPVPSRVQLTLLAPHPIIDEEKHFVDCRLPLGCGLFRPTDSTAEMDISDLSHEAAFTAVVNARNRTPLYEIWPQNGEIWAVHWNCKAAPGGSGGGHGYKLVEVASEFSEEEGVNVFGLARVEGMQGVYRRQLQEGFYLVRCFSRMFMPMFSHRVPATRTEAGVDTRWKVMLH